MDIFAELSSYHLILRLINTGTHPGLDFKEESKIRIFNTSLLIGASILILYCIIGLLNELYFSTIVTFAELLLIGVNFLITRSRNHLLAFHFGFINTMLFLLSIVFILGEQNQAHLYFIFLPLAAMIVFNKTSTILSYLIFNLLLLVGSNYIFLHFKPYYETGLDLFRIPNMVAVTVLAYLSIQLFKTENIKFVNLIRDQKQLLEVKNKDITDSIYYARRIQQALLASETVLSKNLPSFFIVYKPKDIVSGDFYWAEKTKTGFMIAACDCTGHGVPGAFMSLLGVNFLNDIVRDKEVTRPDQVLNHLRTNIIQAMNPEGQAEEGKDGMDAILCHFNFETMDLQYAGANNPLWIIRASGEMEIIAPDHFPVGMHGHEKDPFTLHSVSLNKGDTIYMCTDGFADQFGGDKGKKFMNRRMKELLLHNRHLSMEEQKEIIQNTHEHWKGSLEQVDDVLVIGIRV